MHGNTEAPDKDAILQIEISVDFGSPKKLEKTEF